MEKILMIKNNKTVLKRAGRAGRAEQAERFGGPPSGVAQALHFLCLSALCLSVALRSCCG